MTGTYGNPGRRVGVRRTLGVILCAFALLGMTPLWGCGSEEGKNEPTRRIPIGFIVGTGSNSQQRIDQMFIVIRSINAAGGIELADGKHELDLVPVEHRDSVEGVVAAMELLAEQGVTAAIGPPWSSLVLGQEMDHSDGAVAAAKRLGIVLVSGSATSPAITDIDDDNLMWRTAASDVVHGAVAASYMREHGVETVAILFRDDAWGVGLSSTFSTEFEELGGSVVASVGFPTDGDLDTRSFAAELEQVFAQSPDAVYVVAFSEAFNIALQMDLEGRFDTYGADAPLIFGADGFYGEDLLTNVPASFLSRVVGTMSGADPSTESYASLTTLLAEEGYTGEVDVDATRADAIALIVLAMQAAQSTDAQAIAAALGPVSGADVGDTTVHFGDWEQARGTILSGGTINYEGVSGAIEFDANGDRTQGNLVIWDVEPDGSGAFFFDLSRVEAYDLVQ